MKAEYVSVCQTRRAMVASPTTPTPSRSNRRRRGRSASKVAARPHHCQGGAEEKTEGAGVGTFVDPRGVYPRLVEHRHGDGRYGRDRQGQAHQLVTPAGVTQPEPEQERPDQVKLLLHRQGPEVVERRRWPEASEVGGLADDVPPVAHVDGGGGHVSPEARQLGGVDQGDPGHHHREHQEEGGQ